MKKITAILLTVITLVSLCACNASPKDKGPKTVKETKNLKLEQIIVDDSYRDSDDSPRRALYAFFTINAQSENIEFDSKYMDLTINETNTYSSEVLPGTLCKYVPSFCYSGYIETAYVGETKKLVTTFLVPEGDLVAGRKITFADTQIAEISELVLSTDDIVRVDSQEKVGELADPEGYLEIQKKYEEASPELAEKVVGLITNRYWEAYVNPTWYKVKFLEPYRFVLETTLGENGGSYSVRNGYIFCTYDSNGVTVEIPYEIVEGQGVKMDLGEAFRIN